MNDLFKDRHAVHQEERSMLLDQIRTELRDLVWRDRTMSFVVRSAWYRYILVEAFCGKEWDVIVEDFPVESLREGLTHLRQIGREQGEADE